MSLSCHSNMAESTQIIGRKENLIYKQQGGENVEHEEIISLLVSRMGRARCHHSLCEMFVPWITIPDIFLSSAGIANTGLG